MLLLKLYDNKHNNCDCDALLWSLPKKTCHGVQMVQNAASRNLTGSNKYNHISPVFGSLHLFPVHVRADFKLQLLSYTAVNSSALSYLKEIVVPYEPSRSLCFQGIGLLTVLRVKKKMVGAHVFIFVHHLLHMNHKLSCAVFFSLILSFFFLPAV